MIIESFKARIEYEITPIRHVSVECPNCKSWFRGRDITTKSLSNLIEVEYGQFNCPICGCHFGDGERAIVEECNNSAEVFKDTKEKKIEWK